MDLRFHILSIILLSLMSQVIMAQKVTISESVNLRSNYRYEILGKIDNKILLYSDVSNDHLLKVYDDNLWEKEKVELQFEKKRINAVGLLPGEKDFSFFYTYRKKGDQFLTCRKFTSSGAMLDTATIHVNTSMMAFDNYKFTHSENKRYGCMFIFKMDKSLEVHVFDTKEMEVVWSNSFTFDFSFPRRDFRSLEVTDDGNCFLIFERSSFKIGKPDTHLDITYIEKGVEVNNAKVSFEDKYAIDYITKFDNINQSLIIAGLYGKKNRNKANGYFLLAGESFLFKEFDDALFEELSINERKKVTSLEDYVTSNLVLRQDGGLILITELQRQYSRKSNILEGRRRGTPDLRAYVDYYIEDMVVFAIHPDGKEHWRKVLRKKQFSQDDGGFFSSFFVFKSPTELRLIFNDEIKLDNTVSEYILNPIGENERNIVMNTEYQKLKLRFQEGIQISPTEFIVPSERNSKFNLVMVSF